jgi:hypothetical protein
LFTININCLFAIDSIKVDGYKPLINKNGFCGDYIINVTELRNFNISKDTFQVDSGILDTITFYPLISKNFNYPVLDTSFHRNKPNYNFFFSMSVKNKKDSANALFLVTDIVGNWVFDTLTYYPQSLEIIPELILYGDIYVDSILTKELKFKNNSDTIFAIKEISLKYGKSFKIVDVPKTPFILNKDTLINLKIIYSPKKEILELYETDTLYIKTECLTYSVPLMGRGVEPRIDAEDFDFDIVEVGKSKKKSKLEFPNSYDGLMVWDNGTGMLILSGYSYNPDNSPFKFNCLFPDPDPNNMTIQPNSQPIPIKGLCFQPESAGEFFGEIIFSSNAKGPDNVSRFRGIGFDKGPYITSINFGGKRVGSINKGSVYIKNTGDGPWALTGFELDNNNNGYFRIMYEDMPVKPTPENPVIIFPLSHPDGVTKDIYIPIEFNPKSDSAREVKIFPTFIKDNISQRINLFNYIRGNGILPKKEVYGYNFVTQTLVNVQHPDTGYVLIKSTSQTADLFIKSIDTFLHSNPTVNDFKILRSLPKDTIINRGSSLKIPIIFKPEESGLRKIDFRIITDALPGDFNGTVWDTVFVSVTGTGYNKVLEVTPLRFENVTHCDSTFGVLMVKNISNRTKDTITAFLDKFLIESGDVKAFFIDNELIYQKFVFLHPGDSLGFPVKFFPLHYDTTSFSALARIYSDVDTSITIIKGSSQKWDINVKMDTTFNGIPGQFTLNKPPDFTGTDYPVFINSDYFNRLYIDSIYIELKYRSNDLRFTGIIEKGTAIKNWPDIDFRYNDTVIDSKYNLLKISASGYSPIDTSGTLIIPGFLIMLGDTNGISIKIENLTFFSSNKCIDIVPTDGLIKLSYCGENIRKIMISNKIYDIKIMSVLPVNNNLLSLYYSIGISAKTDVRLYNSYGELIKIISDDYKTAGKYYSDMDITELSSGIYFVTMKSGPYINKVKFVVNK